MSQLLKKGGHRCPGHNVEQTVAVNGVTSKNDPGKFFN